MTTVPRRLLAAVRRLRRVVRGLLFPHRCPSCRQRIQPNQLTCAPCWEALPQPVRRDMRAAANCRRSVRAAVDQHTTGGEA